MIPIQNMLSAFLMLLSAFSLFLGLWAAKIRHRAGKSLVPGATQLTILMLLGAVYAFGYAFEVLSGDSGWILFWIKLQYYALAFIPALLLWLAYDYTGSIGGKLPAMTKRAAQTVLGIGVITFFLVQTGEYHTYYYTAIGVHADTPFPVTKVEPGFWYYVHLAAFIMSAVLSGLVYLRYLAVTRDMDRRRVVVMLLSSLGTLVMFFAKLLDLVPWHLDPGPVVLLANSLFMAYGILYAGLLDLGRLARHLVFENMREGVLVVSDRGIVTDANPAMAGVIPELGPAAIGAELRAVLPDMAGLLPDPDSTARLRTGELEDSRWQEIRCVPVTGPKRRELGRAFFFRDITETMRYIENLEQLAAVDALTGIWNRRHWNLLAEAELERCVRHRRPLAILMIDIDHFKNINDQYGHAVGDDTLRTVAGLLQNSLRRNDQPGRYGGEEFCVLLPEIDKAGAMITAERIRAEIEACIQSIGDEQLRVTVSIGLALHMPESTGDTVHGLLHLADLGLYEAKQSGRNRVAYREAKR